MLFRNTQNASTELCGIRSLLSMKVSLNAVYVALTDVSVNLQYRYFNYWNWPATLLNRTHSFALSHSLVFTKTKELLR